MDVAVHDVDRRPTAGQQREPPQRGGVYDARWELEPGRGIEPGSAIAVNGQAARFTFAIDRWGKRKLGAVTLTLHDRWRLTEGRVEYALPAIDCYPSPAVQRNEVVLSKLPNRLGEHRARVPGDGTEFTGVREFVPGDRQRAINWPASTRLGRLQVNTFAAERSQDVVLLVDATSDVGEPGQSALDLALRGAAGAARALPGGARPGRRDHVPVGRRAMAGPLARTAPGLQDHRRAAAVGGRLRSAARSSAACRGPRCRPAPSWSRSPRCSTGGSSRRCATCASAASR